MLNCFDPFSAMPGEHPLLLQGAVGVLEGVWTIPKEVSQSYFALLGHPHSLYGGTMENKVVTTLAHVFSTLKIPSLRFNFRGVGQSEGHYDSGIGESADLLVIARSLLKMHPQTQLCLAGFSFGAYVTYRAETELRESLLVSIAPPVTHYDFSEFSPKPSTWIVVQGDSDELIDPEAVYTWCHTIKPHPILLTFPNTGHFFHGKLLELRERLSETLEKTLSEFP